MRIPAALKLKNGRIKHVTRELAARYLPGRIVNRPKKGFGFPLALWLRGPLRGLMQRTIDESRFVQAGLFRREALQRMQDEHAGRQGGPQLPAVDDLQPRDVLAALLREGEPRGVGRDRGLDPARSGEHGAGGASCPRCDTTRTARRRPSSRATLGW
jgi:asparagine synthetase B (glutamine-hydrolysing)